MSAINEIIALADKLRAASDLAGRSDSLEQACRESETRLADLRDQESRAQANLTATYDEAKRVARQAENAAKVTLVESEVQARAKLDTCDELCTKAAAASRAKVSALEQKADTAAARVAEYEAEETRLAQSVTALKAELEALKSRFA